MNCSFNLVPLLMVVMCLQCVSGCMRVREPARAEIQRSNPTENRETIWPVQPTAPTAPMATTVPAVPTTSTATTLPPNPCTPPANTAGLSIDETTTARENGLEEDPTAQCDSCSVAPRFFFASATSSDPSEAEANAQVAITADCGAELCLCNSEGICCQPADEATAPDTVLIIPFCANGVCQMNAVQSGSSSSQLTCTDGSTFTMDSQYRGDGWQPLNSDAYFHPDSVGCGNCAALLSNVCRGPAVPVGSRKRLRSNRHWDDLWQ